MKKNVPLPQIRENDFKIIFEQENHDVDVETLIACLMRTSNIIQEVNKHLDTNKKIEVKIKALEKGSFEIHIGLIEKLIQSFFSSEAVSYGANIIAVVGGLYGLVKFLQGQNPKKITQDKETTEITNFKGEKQIFNNVTFNIYNENKEVRENITKQFSVIDKNEDIKALNFVSKTQYVNIHKKDFKKISTKIEPLTENSKEPIIDIVEDKNILIIRPSFTKDLKWDFVYEGQKISAKMNDEEIIKIIDNGEQFAKGDYMLVDLEITKTYNSDLDIHLISDYKILKFKKHIKVAKQQKLF